MTVYPAPKPRRKPKARRPIARKAAPRKVNRKRKRREFERAYHSPEFVRFVQNRFCAVCGHGGYTQAAHTKGDEKKGMGQKTSWRTIAPLCGVRPLHTYDVRVGMYEGCHGLYDRSADFRAQYAARIGFAIKALHAAWQEANRAA